MAVDFSARATEQGRQVARQQMREHEATELLRLAVGDPLVGGAPLEEVTQAVIDDLEEQAVSQAPVEAEPVAAPEPAGADEELAVAEVLPEHLRRARAMLEAQAQSPAAKRERDRQR